MSHLIIPVTQVTPDTNNYNDGTERGKTLIKKSINDYGFTRPLLFDMNDNIMGGNKTFAAALEMGVTEIMVIETEGDEMVIIERTDVDINTPTGRLMTIADNQTAKVDYALNVPNLYADITQGLDVSDYYFPEEIDELLADANITPEVPTDEMILNLTFPTETYEKLKKLLGKHPESRLLELLKYTHPIWQTMMIRV